MLTQEDLQALQSMMETTIDKKLEPINGRLDKIENRLDNIESSITEIKEYAEVTRDALNYLIEQTDNQNDKIRKIR